MRGNRDTTNTDTDNSNVNANTHREIPRLGDLAFKALLENNLFTTSSDGERDSYDRYGSLLFLQSIADANPHEVKKFLIQYPELAVVARGTVTTASGNTYENYSAIELAYAMDDDELIRDVLLSAICKLPPEMIKKAETQLANKMAEVEKQRAQFKPYNFSEIVKAIAADQMLRQWTSK